MNDLATCTKCGTTRPIEDFYASLLRADKSSGQCKSCTKVRVKLHRAANIDAVRAYDRSRSKLPHRIENATRVTREWRRRHRERQSAHNKAARAKSLKAPVLCEGCGQPRRLEKHHPDYSRPLLVVWLCKPCHAIADKLRRKLEAS